MEALSNQPLNRYIDVNVYTCACPHVYVYMHLCEWFCVDVYIPESNIPTMSTIRETTTGMLELRLIPVSTVTIPELEQDK